MVGSNQESDGDEGAETADGVDLDDSAESASESSAPQSVSISRARSSGGARLSIVEVVDNLDRVSEWLAEGLSPRAAASRARQPPPVGLGMTRRTSERYVRYALARMQSDHALEPVESKRARMVATLHGQIRRALDLKRTFEQNGDVVEYAQPDLKAANQALALLAEIEGLKKRE